MELNLALAVEQAFRRTWKMCFKPFSFKKWLGFALVLFIGLALYDVLSLGFRITDFILKWQYNKTYVLSHTTKISYPFEHWVDWIQNHQDKAIVLGIALAIVLGVGGTIELWVASRCRFIFIDCLANNKLRFGTAWKEYVKEGNSYFGFIILQDVLWLVMVLCLLLVGWGVSWQQLYNHAEATTLQIVVLCLLAMIFLAGSLVYWLVQVATVAFVAPIMYTHRISARQAFGIFIRKILLPHLGNVLLFGVLGLGLSMGGGIVIVAFGVATLCIGYAMLMLPFTRELVTLPITMFMNAYGIYYLQQFGEEYRIFKDDLGEPRRAQGFPVQVVQQENSFPPNNGV